MSLGDKRAITVARVGALRVGAFRVGFRPIDTKGVAPGSLGPHYLWDERILPTATWTRIKD